MSDNNEEIEFKQKNIDWNEYDNRLKKFCSFIESRIKNYGCNSPPDPSLLNELNILLFYIETIHLEGHFKEEILEDIDYYSERRLIKDPPKIKDILIGYTVRLNNNIFGSFKHLSEEDHGYYRVDSVGNSYYIEYFSSALDFLNTLRETEPDFEVYNPVEDVINLYKCKHISVDKKNPQNHRCKLLRRPCILAHEAKKEECPNLENLIQQKDFFNDIINEKYNVVENS